MWTDSSSTSVEALQSAVDDTVTHLEQQGLLSGEALGQIFTSVSNLLNMEAGEDQKDARKKVMEGDTQQSSCVDGVMRLSEAYSWDVFIVFAV